MSAYLLWWRARMNRVGARTNYRHRVRKGERGRGRGRVSAESREQRARDQRAREQRAEPAVTARDKGHKSHLCVAVSKPICDQTQNRASQMLMLQHTVEEIY